MRRLAVAALLLIAAALPATLTHAQPAATASSAWVRVASCSVETSSALFHARMKRVRRAARMAMRFTLLERAADGGWDRVAAPGLGRWRRSKPGVAAFGHRQRLRNLSEGSTYRMRVDFRWYARGGKRVHKLRRRSRPCRQFGQLPNLRVVGLELGARGDLPAGVWRYRAVVRNSGKGPAGNVGVRLAVDRTPVDTVEIPSLAPGESRTLEFTGPACERDRSQVKATIDPEAAVPETREFDNVRKQSCGSLPR